MGVLDTLSRFNERVEEGSRKVLDNERFSVQDNVRRGMVRATRHEDEESFARSATQDWDQAMDSVSTPAARAIEGTPADNEKVRGAGRGLRAATDFIAGYPAEAIYGSATGVNVSTDNPDHAHTEFAPDALDTLDAAIIAGPAARGASAAGRGAKAAQAARAGGQSETMIGGLGRVANRAKQAVTGKAPRTATSGRTSTRVEQHSRFRPQHSTKSQRTTTPDHRLPNRARTSVDDAVAGGAASSGGSSGVSLSTKVFGGAAVASLGLGAIGVIGGPDAYPDGYKVDHTYKHDPPADRVRVHDDEGGTLGYWVVVEADGAQLTALNSRADGLMEVEFPTSQSAPFDSATQADSAYEKWQREAQNRQTGAANPTPDQPEPEYVWGESDVVRSLQHGWYLVEQRHTREDNTRYFVTGRDDNGNLLYIDSSGTALQTPTPFPSERAAQEAYQSWVSQAQEGTPNRAPDPGQDRPNPDAVVRDVRTAGVGGGGGGLGTIGVVAAGGLAAVVVALVVMVIL